MSRLDPTLEEVLDQLAMESAISGPTLRSYIDAYPQFEGEILDFALEAAMPDASEEAPTARMEAAGDRLLAGLTAALQQSVPAGNPLKGLDIASLETSTGIALPILDALRKGLVEVQSMPEAVIRKLVTVTHMNRNRLLSGLTLASGLSPSLEFKSASKPTAGRPMPFSYYLENSGLSDDEIERTLAE